MVIYEPYHGNDVWIETTDEQKDAAIREGVRQREYSRTHGHKNRCEWYNPNDKAARRGQALGELAQMIACVGLGVPITHRPQTFKAPDLATSIQVRLIGREHYGLRVYSHDEDDWCVLGIVIPKGRERDRAHRSPGWFLASEAKQHPEWSIEPYGPPPMFCVPQSNLWHLEELRRLLP